MDVPRTVPVRRRARSIPAVAVAVVAGVAVLTVGLRMLSSRAPAVERSTLWTGTVTRGPMEITARGTGRLVPEEVRWASAPITARVDQVLVQPGAQVTPESVLLVLVNPDAELALLAAEREVAGAVAELARLEAALDTARLAQEAQVAALEAEQSIARRRAEADGLMAKKGFLSPHEGTDSADRARQAAARLELETRRLEAMNRGEKAQLRAQKAELERLNALVRFRKAQLEALTVRAGTTGVVQDVRVEVGQTVIVGAPMARVVNPERLKAVLRVPETQAEDLAVGIPAVVDTRTGLVKGSIIRVDPAAQGGTVTVDVALEGELPRAARPDLTVDGVFQLARLDSVLSMERPAVGEPRGQASLFRLGEDHAERVTVTLGRASVDRIEVSGGLAEGDRVILSDMSRWDGVDRLRLK